jgi:hypothetical protein
MTRLNQYELKHFANHFMEAGYFEADRIKEAVDFLKPGETYSKHASIFLLRIACRENKTYTFYLFGGGGAAESSSCITFADYEVAKMITTDIQIILVRLVNHFMSAFEETDE